MFPRDGGGLSMLGSFEIKADGVQLAFKGSIFIQTEVNGQLGWGLGQPDSSAQFSGLQPCPRLGGGTR